MAVVRALKLGDLLCAVPAFRALRAALPSAHISLVGLPWARELAGRFPAYLDEVLEFPGYPGIPERAEDPERLTAFLAEARRRRFDLALQMHGDGSVMNGFITRLGARHEAGFGDPSNAGPAARFLRYPDDRPEPLRLLRLLDHIGIPPRGIELEFPITAGDRRQANELLHELAPAAAPPVCVHAGGSTPERRWHAGHFASVADELAARGYPVVLTGSAAERRLVAAVAATMHHRPLDLAGRTSLGVLGAVIERSRLLIANDTGVSHLAAAVRTPSVVVFTGSDPSRWAPLDARLHRALGAGIPDAPARGGQRVRPPGVQSAQVLAAALELLGHASAGAA